MPTQDEFYTQENRQKSPLNAKATGYNIYEQYRKSEVIKAIFQSVKEVAQDEWDKTPIYNREIAGYKDSQTDYFIFFLRHYLGVFEPRNAREFNHDTEQPDNFYTHWDVNRIKWDSLMNQELLTYEFIWDDSFDLQDELDLDAIRSMAGFMLDYNVETWTHDFIVKFIVSLVKVEGFTERDIEIQVLPYVTKYILPYWSAESSKLAAFIKSAWDELNMPYPYGQTAVLEISEKQWIPPSERPQIAVNYEKPNGAGAI